MTTADRPALIRCTLFLSGLAWILPFGVLGLCVLLINDLGSVDPFSSQASHVGSETISIGLSSIFKGNSLAAFTVALAVFAVFALGGLLATASLCTGRMAMRLGANNIPLAVGLLAAGLYLTIILGMVLGATIN